MDRSVERDSHCFACGKDNEQGLRLTFVYPEAGAAETSLEVPEHFSGWKRMTHGGFLSLLLDEVMAHACLGAAAPGEAAITGEITVRFLKPVETGTRITAKGRRVETKGRIISTKGWIYDSGGAPAAEATARFLAVKRPQG
jgi:uncharacterized protein (TIGR00369 family)